MWFFGKKAKSSDKRIAEKQDIVSCRKEKSREEELSEQLAAENQKLSELRKELEALKNEIMKTPGSLAIMRVKGVKEQIELSCERIRLYEAELEKVKAETQSGV